ncbi:hypothetical protein V2W45_1241425, partial [Cenococcum geophilum]
LRSWIGAYLNRNNWDNILCSENGYREMLRYTNVKRFTSPEEFIRYDFLSSRSALNAIPNFRWCITSSYNGG